VATVWLAGVSAKRHGASWDTRANSLLIVIVPSRTDAPSFAATRNVTLPLPCPDAGDTLVIQLALVDAVHAHSGCVLTVTELFPPAASIMAGAVSATWHLTGSGPADTVDVVSHPAAAIATTTDRTAGTNRRLLVRTRWVIRSTTATAGASGASCIPVAMSADHVDEDPVAEVDRLAEVLIVLSGLPGVGKTTIARALAAALHAVHVRIDSIEHALRSAGWNVDSEGYRVAYAIAEDNLRLGRTVVADCVNPWPATRREWSLVADRAAVRALPVEVLCSDVDEHRRRVEARVADIAGHRLPTWADVIERDYRPWDVDRLVVDTARLNVQQSVQTILSAISA
jgi:predicted kinase